MLYPSSDSVGGVPEPPGDFKDNYNSLKTLINSALKDGIPIEDLHLVPKDPANPNPKRLSKDDLLRLLHALRRLRSRYQRLLQSPVPRELVRDILAKSVEDRLPWEDEALEKHEKWRGDVAAIKGDVQRELNDHLNDEFFKDL